MIIVLPKGIVYSTQFIALNFNLSLILHCNFHPEIVYPSKILSISCSPRRDPVEWVGSMPEWHGGMDCRNLRVVFIKEANR